MWDIVFMLSMLPPRDYNFHYAHRGLISDSELYSAMADGSDNSPGPDPSTLKTHDHLPEGIKPMSLRVTYTESSLSDYVSLKRSNGSLCIELGPPLFGVVSKAGKLNRLKNELKEALTAIGISGIIAHFSDTVMTYARDILPQTVLPETIGLGAAVYALKKLWEKGKLMLGYIQHASIDELNSWMGLVEKAKQNPNIGVNSGNLTL